MHSLPELLAAAAPIQSAGLCPLHVHCIHTCRANPPEPGRAHAEHPGGFRVPRSRAGRPALQRAPQGGAGQQSPQQGGVHQQVGAQRQHKAEPRDDMDETLRAGASAAAVCTGSAPRGARRLPSAIWAGWQAGSLPWAWLLQHFFRPALTLTSSWRGGLPNKALGLLPRPRPPALA